MKNIQTNKTHSFSYWRTENIPKYGDFIWVQLNYTIDNYDILNVIFEEKENINNNLNDFIIKYIKPTFKYNIINLGDRTSKNYIDAFHLKEKLGLKLTCEYNGPVDSYWEYRLKTKPTNCISSDIDSIELIGQIPIGIEATYLFNTTNINESIKHIYRTFAFRKNKVNPYQYIIQQKFMKTLSGKSYILFHQLNQNRLDDKEKVLILENNLHFSNILLNICYNNISEYMFLEQYKSYLFKNILIFDNIYKGYDYILNS